MARVTGSGNLGRTPKVPPASAGMWPVIRQRSVRQVRPVEPATWCPPFDDTHEPTRTFGYERSASGTPGALQRCHVRAQWSVATR